MVLDFFLIYDIQVLAKISLNIIDYYSENMVNVLQAQKLDEIHLYEKLVLLWKRWQQK